MNLLSDTRLELYLHEPHDPARGSPAQAGSARVTPLALSLIIHVVAIVGIALLHFGTNTQAAPWRSRAMIIAPVLPKTPALRKPARLRPLKNAIAPPADIQTRVEARAFHAPNPVVEHKPEPAMHLVDAPPAIAPIAASLPTAAPHLPVLPAPPMKTDNLSSAAAAGVTATNGRVESSGFVTAGVSARGPSVAGAQESVGAFGGTTVSKRATSEAPRIAQGAFGSATASASRGQAEAPRAVVDTPVEILEKPRPPYTDEARRMGLEGEVLVEALFPAAGPARVLRVIRGLGHGLDQNAVAAAQAIRFRPATHAGQAVDSTAVVHIVFQIAF